MINTKAPGTKAPGTRVNQSRLVEIFGTTRLTVDLWTRKGMPIISRGAGKRPSVYDTADCIRWYGHYLLSVQAEKYEKQGISKPKTLDGARERKVSAEADFSEIKLARLRGELVAVEFVTAAVKQEYSVLRANLLTLPGKIAGRAAGKSVTVIQDIIQTELYECLDELTQDKRTDWREEIDEGIVPGALPDDEASA